MKYKKIVLMFFNETSIVFILTRRTCQSGKGHDSSRSHTVHEIER